MSLKLPTLLFCLTLCSTAQAAPSVEAEADYQRAVRMAEANAQQASRLVEQEQLGQLDKPAMAQALHAFAQEHDAMEHELRKASDGGHAVASYLLANLESHFKLLMPGQREQRQAQACALYQTAADQGLLAAAVAMLRECQTAMLRFAVDDPELQRLRAQLLKALERPDPYADYYPLPTSQSLCFKGLDKPTLDPQRPLGAVAQTFTPVSLALQQYRADAYYSLIVMGDVDEATAQAHFKQVQALTTDCLDPMNLSAEFQGSGTH